MKVEEQKNDLLLNEENMTQLGFSEEVKQYVRERQDIHREMLKQKEEERFEKMVEELDRKTFSASSVQITDSQALIQQLKEVNQNLHEIHKNHYNKLYEISENLADFKSDFSSRGKDNIYFTKVFGTFISMLLIILIIITFAMR